MQQIWMIKILVLDSKAKIKCKFNPRLMIDIKICLLIKSNNEFFVTYLSDSENDVYWYIISRIEMF